MQLLVLFSVPPLKFVQQAALGRGVFPLVYTLSPLSFHWPTAGQNTEREQEENHPLRDFLKEF